MHLQQLLTTFQFILGLLKMLCCYNWMELLLPVLKLGLLAVRLTHAQYVCRAAGAAAMQTPTLGCSLFSAHAHMALMVCGRWKQRCIVNTRPH
jgi:hypothetical protein